MAKFRVILQDWEDHKVIEEFDTKNEAIRFAARCSSNYGGLEYVAYIDVYDGKENIWSWND